MSLGETAIHLLQKMRVESDDVDIYRRLLDSLCRHAHGPVNASRAAQMVATEMGLGDLRDYTWEGQVSLMRDKGRKIFAWDHYLPVRELRTRIESLAAPTAKAADAVLSCASIVWILRAEDSRLNALKFRSVRPDPAAAYAKAGIELAYSWRAGFPLA